jgi:hypothetical protein
MPAHGQRRAGPRELFETDASDLEQNSAALRCHPDTRRKERIVVVNTRSKFRLRHNAGTYKHLETLSTSVYFALLGTFTPLLGPLLSQMRNSIEEVPPIAGSCLKEALTGTRKVRSHQHRNQQCWPR